MNDVANPSAMSPTEALELLLDGDMRTHESRGERAALRAALGSAAGFCDLMAKQIERANTHGSRVTHAGVALADVARRIGDELWRAREKIRHPPAEHWSDCAVHNAPALPAGECDCGGIQAGHVIKRRDQRCKDTP